MLMNVIDAFKSLGFDHQRHTNYELFGQHLDYLENQNLMWHMEKQFNSLTKLGILQTMSTTGDSEVPKDDRREVYEAFFQFWCAASKQLISNATFTQEDQKYFAYLDERQKAEETKPLSGAVRTSHVFVDEFQDINPLDLNLVKAIMQRNRAMLTVVGDDDQAIYEWRGATPEYILNPGKFFEADFDTHVLDINYRSPANIVAHSKCLIEHNQRRVQKLMNASSQESASVNVKRTADMADALDYVCRVIDDSIAQGTSPAKVAVIGRKRSQIIPYQIHFARKDISFCTAEDLSVFLSETFKRLLNLIEIKIRASSRQRSSQVAKDVLQLCNLVKRYPLNKKDEYNVRKHLNVSRPTSVEASIDILAHYRGNLKGSNTDGQMSVTMAEAIRKFVAAETVRNTLLTLGADFEGLQTDMGKAEDDIFYTDPPFFQLAELASSYEDDYDQFIDDIERAKEQLVYTPPFSDEEQGKSANELWKRPVHLMTALRAKGKEFDTVVLLDTVDGIWPNQNANTSAQLEAERRVFYVAFTRARKRVVMLVSDHMGGRKLAISPYIEELGL
ncbi:MAG: hypothetical protein TH68_07865 [Candidatus Synechococcus spongiarum 142]|uniref:DNA 3'-5' helicase n=1 Tax=Candidatus Synechococcus spongiarum 142 TaxID=1608213 RepID=A0A6N3XBI9_9SYNE|nr:MAG: hypothetical protein TH68_07865 [Candidatus Synechococcus spongiarum 142]